VKQKILQQLVRMFKNTFDFLIREF